MFRALKDKIVQTEKGLVRTLTVLSISQLIGWGSLYYSFSLFIEPIQQDLGWSHNRITAALTLSILVWACSAPVVATYLDRGMGRGVMTLGSLSGSIGLLLWGLFPESLNLFYLSWILIGFGLAMSLYESACSILAKRYQERYRQSISLLTIAGGFASTIFIPFIQFCIDHIGWQNSIYVLACLNLFLAVPLHYLGIEKPRDLPVSSTAKSAFIDLTLFSNPDFKPIYFWGLFFWMISYNTTSASVSFLFIPVLSALDVEMSVIVFSMALIGPMQVAGRFSYLPLSRFLSFHNICGLLVILFITSTTFITLFGSSFKLLVVFVVLFGFAKGIMTIIKSTAVMELMSAEIYARTNGWLSLGAKAAQALTPVLFSLAWNYTGSPESIITMTWISSLFMIPGVYLLRTGKSRKS